MTIMAYVYPSVDPTSVDAPPQQDILSGWVDDVGGIEFSLADFGNSYGPYFIKVYSITGGNWYHDTSVSNGEWKLVTATIDKDTVKFYVDDTEKVTTEFVAPTGNVESWDGMDLCIGNIVSTDYDTNLKKPFIGKITDIRVYNRVITAAEVAAINTAGIGGSVVLDGLVFRAPYVKTSELAHYTDLTMTESDTVIDGIGGYAGTPKDSPTARLLT
jgi:hypothetical protein